MDLNALKAYCMSKKGATENFPFDDVTLVFKVGSKMFGLTDISDPKLKISLKCDPLFALDLRREFSAIKPGWHLNKTHWNTVEIDGTIPEESIFMMINLSYDLVFKGLKKAEKNII